MKMIFNKYSSLLNAHEEYFALEDAVEKIIDNVKYLEITQDFKRINYIREDSLCKTGTLEREMKCF